MTVLGEALRALPEETFADVHESEDAYLVVLDVPGVAEEALTVEAGKGFIEITATRTGAVPEEYEPVSTGRSSELDVALPLPPEARGDGLTTTLERGVLTLTVPKTDRSGPDDGGSDTEATD